MTRGANENAKGHFRNFAHDQSNPIPIEAGLSAEGVGVEVSINNPSPQFSISRDEMNLSEFPLTVLSTRANSSIKTLEFKDSIRGKNGETINRQWIITAADKFGLPTSSDDEVLLGLLKLTADRQFSSRKVLFSRYELLKNLRWSTEGRSYSRLQKALDRLSGVRIKATNAFFDNTSKSHSTKNFGIIDGYELNDGRDNDRPSFFSWSDVIFRSFQAGFIKKLDLNFYLALQSSVSKRLYRYLDKHFWYRSKIQMNLFVFAHEKVGISRTYQFVSSIRQQLDAALDELREAKFISGYEYRGQGKGTEIIVTAASATPRSQGGKTLRQQAEIQTPNISDDSGDAQDGQQFDVLRTKLTQRGISASQAQKLLSAPEVDLERVSKIISHFDYLLSIRSTLVSRNSVGFLYRAIQNSANFQLPGDKANFRNGKETGSQITLDFRESASATSRAGAQDERDKLKARYLTERKLEVNKLRSEVEKALLQRMRTEVETALQKLRGLISESRFEEAVDHGVEEKLAKLFAFPEYEEWLKGANKKILQ